MSGQTPPKIQKLPYQELNNPQWTFIFIPKHDKILGIKSPVVSCYSMLDNDNKPKINVKTGELVLGINTANVVQYFTREEYKEQIALTGKPDI